MTDQEIMDTGEELQMTIAGLVDALEGMDPESLVNIEMVDFPSGPAVGVEELENGDIVIKLG